MGSTKLEELERAYRKKITRFGPEWLRYAWCG